MAKEVPALPPPAEDNLIFEIEVSDFTYVRRKTYKDRALRFTLTWKLDHPKYGLLGISQEGWLLTKNSKGKICVAPPLTRFGIHATKQLNLVTVGLHDLIIGLIVNHKTKKGKSYADYLGGIQISSFAAENPADFDPELPQEIDNVRSGS